MSGCVKGIVCPTLTAAKSPTLHHLYQFLNVYSKVFHRIKKWKLLRPHEIFYLIKNTIINYYFLAINGEECVIAVTEHCILSQPMSTQNSTLYSIRHATYSINLLNNWFIYLLK